MALWLASFLPSNKGLGLIRGFEVRIEHSQNLFGQSFLSFPYLEVKIVPATAWGLPAMD